MKYLNYKVIGGIIIIFCAGLFTECTKSSDVTKTVTLPKSGNSPAISSVTPLKALATSQISIYGTNFNTMLANNKVTVNGIAATVDSASATEVVFTLPVNATSGSIKLVTGSISLTYSNNFTVVSPYQLSTFANIYYEHIAVDANGNAYGDGYPHGDGGSFDTLNKVTSLGAYSVLAVLPDTSRSYNPTIWGTAVDAAGNIYEASEVNNCIYKITPAGTVRVLAGSDVSGHADGQGNLAQFDSPLGLAIDVKGNLYTNDNHYIRKITPAGIVTTIAGTGADGHADGPISSATFGTTEGIGVDVKGNIYVSDHEYHNIRKISPSGTVSTLAGNGIAGFTDGQGNAAQFYFPQAMALDAAGNIFLSDNEYDTNIVYNVRMITQDGVVTTFLKGGGSLSPPLVGKYVSATVSYPDGLAFDSSGSLYICNTLIYPGKCNASITKLIFK